MIVVVLSFVKRQRLLFVEDENVFSKNKILVRDAMMMER